MLKRQEGIFEIILVLTGILYAAILRADFAIISETPRISYRIFPGLTTATQNSTLPLPDPILVSAALNVTGLSGKILIHSLPPLFA